MRAASAPPRTSTGTPSGTSSSACGSASESSLQPLDQVEGAEDAVQAICVRRPVGGEGDVREAPEPSGVAGLDPLPGLPPTAHEVDPMDLDRQLERGPEDVEEAPVFAPTHGGFQGQGAGNRTRLPAFDRDEHELLARTRDRHLLPVGRY